jgi:hypothetical protein
MDVPSWFAHIDFHAYQYVDNMHLPEIESGIMQILLEIYTSLANHHINWTCHLLLIQSKCNIRWHKNQVKIICPLYKKFILKTAFFCNSIDSRLS